MAWDPEYIPKVGEKYIAVRPLPGDAYSLPMFPLILVRERSEDLWRSPGTYGGPRGLGGYARKADGSTYCFYNVMVVPWSEEAEAVVRLGGIP